MVLNGEQIMKALECCGNKGSADCTNCPMDEKKGCAIELYSKALEFIKELTEDDEDLKAQCKYTTEAFHSVRADTVKKMQESIKTGLIETYGTLPHTNYFFKIVDKTAKEILEENK